MSSAVPVGRADTWIERGKDECRDTSGGTSTAPPYGDQKDGAKSTAYDQTTYMNLRHKYNRRTIQDQGRPKREAARSMCRPLKQWLYAHRDLPYPTRADKVQLAGVARMSVVQVSNWFANARRRLKRTVGSTASVAELSWERRFKLYNRNVVGNQERLSISSDDDDDDDDDDHQEMTMERAEAEELFTSGNDDSESCDGAISSTSGQPSFSSSSTTSGNSSGEEKDGVAPPGERRCANNNIMHRLLLLPGKFKQGILHRYLSDAVGISYVIESNDDVSDSKLSGSPSSRDSALSASCRSTPTGDRQYEEVFERAAARLSGSDPGHGESDEYDLASLELSAVHTLASLAAASNRKSLTKTTTTRNNALRQQQQQQQQ